MRYLACPSSHSLSAETAVPRFAVDLDLLPRRRSCSGTIGKRCASCTVLRRWRLREEQWTGGSDGERQRGRQGSEDGEAKLCQGRSTR